MDSGLLAHPQMLIQDYSTVADDNHVITVNSQYFKVLVQPKLLISPSKFSGPRKLTLRYQYFEIAGVEMLEK